ncbi:MAG: TAT-variant-translocated molybdopterin oxidoreductase, partial [Myxococcales bacterium]|nr:TAT-variant-translocated molybdopterin oxidoreductase [Myxococcales bacterium]
MTKRPLRQWRSLADLSSSPAHVRDLPREFGSEPEEIAVDPVSRRGFLGLVGATAAFAGLEGCVRKPAQYILPYAHRPEELIPGRPRYFASVLHVGGNVQGVLVESQDGRPTKIEGNPNHPASLGRTTAQVQAAVLGMYDGDRSQGAVVDGTPTAAAEVIAGLAARAPAAGTTAILTTGTPSPTLTDLLEQLARRGVQLYVDGPDSAPHQGAAYAQLGAPGVVPAYDVASADVIVALDSDFLASGPNSVAHAAGFATGRSVDRAGGMNRLYAVEPHFSTTGASADNRFQIPASQVGAFAKAVAGRLVAGGAQLPAGAESLRGQLSATSSVEGFDKWVGAVADDLLAHRGRALVVVGERQPAWVHAVGALINELTGGVGRTVRYVEAALPTAGSLNDLVTAVDAGRVQALVVLGGNPVYSAPGDVDFAATLAKVATSVHVGFHYDETGRAAKIHLPEAHALEAWGDLRSTDGTAAIAQPLVEPLYASYSAIEVAQALLGQEPNGLEAVRAYWQATGFAPDFEATWRSWLHAGKVDAPAPAARATFGWSTASTLLGANAPAAPSAGSYELALFYDQKVYDGRYANNAWLQELPDTVSKITWDNAALVNPVTARALGIEFRHADDDENIPSTFFGGLDAQLVTVSVNGKSLTLPALVTPGVEANTIAIALGYGREFGTTAARVGFASHTLMKSGEFFSSGATVALASGTYPIATTQDHGSMEGRPLLRQGTVEELRENPEFVHEMDEMEPSRLRSLWEEPNVRTGQQWGMSIDLSTCIGCNACTIACQAENTISVVGKERVLEGREMHWIRLDRYFAGDPQNPTVSVQPVACMHCENAPCEQVCPVAATTHGPEGTNDMAYNRCIGTRYCANNCPYKVRRYNFFNFSNENDERNPLYRLQKNPDVTVRFRGVMEKCTYCIQRVNQARIDAKVTTPEGTVADGGVTP